MGLTTSYFILDIIATLFYWHYLVVWSQDLYSRKKNFATLHYILLWKFDIEAHMHVLGIYFPELVATGVSGSPPHSVQEPSYTEISSLPSR